MDRIAPGVAIPKLGVHGNHDTPGLLREVEVEDLHGRRTSLFGMTVAGFEGCVRYGGGGRTTTPRSRRRSSRGGCRPPRS